MQAQGRHLVWLAGGACRILENAAIHACPHLFGGVTTCRLDAVYLYRVRMQEEIVNACGVDDIHDGVNYVRTACVIAVSKSKEIFEPLIHQVFRQIGAPVTSTCCAHAAVAPVCTLAAPSQPSMSMLK